ncbi:DUF397 domain-containing protein [Streptomyces sp. NPDC004610]|uniref:DUF397 domain-containing protein n=1 Tax=unclassified Streptomyces TaxID=2593676 RepID=UPI0033A14CF1
METFDNWRKSSYSSFGDGDSCVEVAGNHSRVGIRDSKTPTTATLTFPTPTFTTFLESLKVTPEH